MANAAVDWTVDKVLSGIATLNARSEAARNAIRAARQSYTQAVKNVGLIPDEAAKAKMRAYLVDWIHKQVAIENRYNDFAAKFAAAKAQVKSWLQNVGITPPGYMGAAILVPIAIGAAIAAALLLIAAIIIAATNNGHTIDGANAIIAMAQREHWTPEQLDAALKRLKDAAAGPPPPDPTGIANILKSALPVALLVGAIVLLGPLMKRKAAA